MIKTNKEFDEMRFLRPYDLATFLGLTGEDNISLWGVEHYRDYIVPLIGDGLEPVRLETNTLHELAVIADKHFDYTDRYIWESFGQNERILRLMGYIVEHCCFTAFNDKV